MYNDKAVTNIVAKVRFTESVLKNAALFYPYTIVEGERPDQIAERYYGKAEYDWIIYFSNDITDPYYEWPRTDEEVNKMLASQFGSVAAAQQKISHYAVNHSVDDRVITTSAFQALTAGAKKYWMPITGYRDEILNYQRRPIDHFVDTNMVVSLTGTFDDVTAGERITKGSASGYVKYASSTEIVINHITGAWSTGSFDYGSITAVATIATSIPDGEADYWTSVTEFDKAHLLNESRKTIQLLAPNYIDKIERDMRELLV